MEFILKGTHLLRWMQPGEIKAMEQAVFSRWQESRTTFKFLKVTAKDIVVGVSQAKTTDEKYFTQKELIGLVHETLDHFFPDHRLIVHASPYRESPALKVDSTWIKKKMEKHGVKLKDIASETGLNNTQLSTLINGGKPLSDAMKAMFYFYFAAKEK